MKFDPTRWQIALRPETISTYQRTVHINRFPEEVFAFITKAENFPKIFPYKVEAAPELDESVVKLNHVYPFKVWYGIMPINWVAIITDYVHNKLYVDEVLEGPFKFWRHTHLCEADAKGGTKYTDRIEFKAPLGWIGEKFLMSGQLDKLFEHRQKKMKELIEQGEQ